MKTGFVHTLLAHAIRIARQSPLQLTAVVAAVLLGGGGATYAVGSLAPDASDLPTRTVVEAITPLPISSQIELLEAQTLKLYRSDVMRASDTVDSLLKRVGVFDPQAADFLRSDALVRQTLLGRNGRNVSVEADDDNTLLKLSARWSLDEEGMFKRLTVMRTASGFRSQVETQPLTASSRLASGTIVSSLFAATDAARIPDSIAIQLAEIFSGDIDFHRALRKGDRFSVVYETLEGDGEPMRAGRVLSAEFVNAGKQYQAMWFQESGPQTAVAANAAQGQAPAARGGYYNLAGESLRRAFLASPMEFSRVTSGFKMRMHPILQTMRAHQGVDYGAPTGTPVRTVADGIVEFAGVQNGFGNVVHVKHRNGSSTVYAHLSRIGVRRGQSVNQGQHIGAVGQTGWATGPHLHFEFRVNGVHRDPLAIARQSESVPVAPSARKAFASAATMVRTQLAAASQILATTTQ